MYVFFVYWFDDSVFVCNGSNCLGEKEYFAGMQELFLKENIMLACEEMDWTDEESGSKVGDDELAFVVEPVSPQ